MPPDDDHWDGVEESIVPVCRKTRILDMYQSESPWYYGLPQEPFRQGVHTLRLRGGNLAARNMSKEPASTFIILDVPAKCWRASFLDIRLTCMPPQLSKLVINATLDRPVDEESCNYSTHLPCRIQRRQIPEKVFIFHRRNALESGQQCRDANGLLLYGLVEFLSHRDPDERCTIVGFDDFERFFRRASRRTLAEQLRFTFPVGRAGNPPPELTPQVIDEVLGDVRFITHEQYHTEVGEERYLLENDVTRIRTGSFDSPVVVPGRR